MKKSYSKPILIALLLLLTGVPNNIYAQYADTQDSLILVDFQNAMMQKGWPQFWDTTKNISNWSGVTLDNGTGKVTEVYIYGSWFSPSFTTDSLPSCISILKSLDNLVDLSFHNFGLKYLPEVISEFENLESLSLSYNNFTDIPAFLGKIENLKYLALLYNQLTDLPEELSGLTSLENLSLSVNKTLTQLPDVVTKLPSLTDLDISYCSITTLPEEIKNLKNLENLDATSCKISSLPDSIGELPALKTLELDNNKLSSLPESMGNLKNLNTLNVSVNSLIKLPESFSKLLNLADIRFYDNQLDSFPSCLAGLPKLYYIKAENNNMKDSIPAEIFERTGLRLFLDNNNLSGKIEIQNDNIPERLYITNNCFTLKDIIEHYNLFSSANNTYIEFQPQQNIGTFRTFEPSAGDDVPLGIDNYEPVSGCQITWYKAVLIDETGTPVATAADDTLNIEDFDSTTDAGVYYCIVTHPDLDGLSLTSNRICLIGDTDAPPSLSADDVLFRCGNDAMLHLSVSDDFTRIQDLIFDIPDTTRHFILRPDSVTNYPNNRYIFPKEGVLAAIDTVKVSITDGGGNTSSTEVIIKMVTTENQPPKIKVPLIYMNLYEGMAPSCIPEDANCNESYIFASETYLDNYVTDDYTSSGKLTFSAVIDSINGVNSNSDTIFYVGTNLIQVLVTAKSDVIAYVSLTASDDEGGTSTEQILLKGIGISQSPDDPNDPPEIAPIPEQVIEKGTTAFDTINLKNYISDDYLSFEELEISLSTKSVTAKIQKDSMLYVSPIYPDSVYSGSLTITVTERRNSLNNSIAEIYYRVVEHDLSVLFYVTDKGAPVKDALISINGSRYLTDGLGYATVSLPQTGSYSYTVDDAYGDPDYQKATGTVTLTGIGITENVQLTLKNATAINDEPRDTEAPCIYPNPVHGILSIDLPSGTKADAVEVCDITGIKVYSAGIIGLSSVQIDMGDYPEGVYVVRGLLKGKVVFSGKVIRDLP